MKRLVVYFTRSGHSKRIAETVCKTWQVDSVEIVDLNKRTGLFGFVLSGMDSSKGRVATIELAKDPLEYDEIILISPIWAGKTPPAVNAYLEKYPVKYAIVSSGGPIITERLAPVKAKLKAEKLLALSKKEWAETDKINEWLTTL